MWRSSFISSIVLLVILTTSVYALYLSELLVDNGSLDLLKGKQKSITVS